MFDVVVIGGAAFDYLVHAPELPTPERTVHGDTFQKGPGGKGFNQAVAAARLGARVAFVTRVGRDAEGDAIVDALRHERIDITWVVRDEDVPTTSVVIAVDRRGRKQTVAVPGASARLSVADVEAAATALAEAPVLLMQLEVPFAVLQRARQIAGRARHVLDPAPARRVPESLLAGIDVVKPNALEAEALSGIRVDDRSSASRAAAVLRSRGARAVVVAQAGDGVLIVDDDGEHYVPHLDVVTVDTTGAGDALAAGLAVGLSEGRGLVAAVHFGVAAAALTTTRIGAYGALPQRAEAEELLRKAEGRR